MNSGHEEEEEEEELPAVGGGDDAAHEQHQHGSEKPEQGLAPNVSQVCPERPLERHDRVEEKERRKEENAVRLRQKGRRAKGARRYRSHTTRTPGVSVEDEVHSAEQVHELWTVDVVPAIGVVVDRCEEHRSGC